MTRIDARIELERKPFDVDFISKFCKIALEFASFAVVRYPDFIADGFENTAFLLIRVIFAVFKDVRELCQDGM